MCLSSEKKFFKLSVSKLRTIIRINSILTRIINAKVAKTKASFFVFKVLNTWKYNVFSGNSSNRLPGLDFFWHNPCCSSYCCS